MVNEDNTIAVPVPNISYNNRIALAIKARQNTNFAEFVAMNEGLVETDPGILDNLDTDTQFRDSWRNAGLPEDSLRPEEEVAQIRQQRAEAQAQAEQMAKAEQAASIAKDASAANGGQLPEEMTQAMAG